MKDRIIELDYIRALSIILIVLCHLHYFINSSFLDKWSFFPLAFFGLNLFFMLSGFLLNHNVKINSKDEIIVYIKKRVRRIYPLYWLAFISFMVLDLLNISYFVGTIRNTELIFLNILGLQGLFPTPYTIYGMWFIGVILLYYLVYIFICSYSRSINEILLRSFIIMIPFIILRIKFGLIRPEFFIYYPTFVGGILAAEVRNLKNFLNVAVYYFMIISSLCIVYFYGFLPLNSLLYAVGYLTFGFIGIFLVLTYGIYTSRQKNANIFLKSQNKIVSIIAYSSYSIFLFHVTILSVFTVILHKATIYNGFLYDFLILTVGIPVIFIIGYYIPKISNL